jgi:multiple sugar transport system permease protein
MGVALTAVRRPTTARTRSFRTDRLVRRIGFYLVLLLLMAPVLFVFYWMLSLALKPDVENVTYPPVFVPEHPTLDNFVQVFQKSPFGLYTLNSFVVALASTALSLVLGVPAAYGIIKGRWRGPALFVLIARMTPALSFLIPWFILFRFLGLNNTLWALIITHLVIGLPLTVWVMMGFFEGMHPEIEEAARVDGCSVWQAFRLVSLPLSRPGVVVAAILAFIFSWNNFMFALVLSDAHTKTLPVAIFNFVGYASIDWGGLMAAATVVTLPIMVIALFTQKYIVSGLTAGATKG